MSDAFSRRALIAGDDSFLALSRRALGGRGLDLLEAGTVTAAESLLSSGKPALVIASSAWAVEDDWRLLKSLAGADLPGTGLVVVSGTPDVPGGDSRAEARLGRVACVPPVAKTVRDAARRLLSLPAEAASADLTDRQQALLMNGGRCLREGDMKGAVGSFAALIRERKDSPAAYISMATALASLGDTGRASASLQLGVEACLRAGRDREALKMHGKAYGIAGGGLTDPFLRMGRRMLDAGDPLSAAAVLIRGVLAGSVSSEIFPVLRVTGLFAEPKTPVRSPEPESEEFPNAGNGKSESAVQEPVHAAEICLDGMDWAESGDSCNVVILDEKECDFSGADKRCDPRIPLADWFVVIPGLGEPLAAVDLSMGGVGFKDPQEMLEPGREYVLNLTQGDKVRLKKVRAEIRHRTEGVTGAAFRRLSSRQLRVLQKIFDTVLSELETEGFVLETASRHFNIGMW